jgi:diaminopimelate epimerase
MGNDIIFRLFEPNGVESFSCGNGLMCVAKYLNLGFDVLKQKILTQIPTANPKYITIGTDLEQTKSWANMGQPCRVPREVAKIIDVKCVSSCIDILNDIEIRFRAHDLHPFSGDTALKLNGYLVYTGEPHFVIIMQNGVSIESLKKMMFLSSSDVKNVNGKAERRTVFGSWLVHHIGTYLNKQYREIFPSGINADFVRIPTADSVVEYRCFERGINKETLACGTGALAVAFVARQLNLIHSSKITVWPHRCRWYDLNAFIDVEEKNKGWIISGKPIALLNGDFFFNESLSPQIGDANSSKFDKDHSIPGDPEFGYQHVYGY